MSIIPNVIETSRGGERFYDIYSRLLKDRIIFLGEEVTDVSASIVVAQMLFLDAWVRANTVDLAEEPDERKETD